MELNGISNRFFIIMIHKKNIGKITLIVIAVLAVTLIGARIYLPFWVKDYVNKEINTLEGYSGFVDDIDISLWRGAYQINHLEIYKDSGNIPVPFVRIETADLSVEWMALFHGNIVAEIDLYEADLNFAIGTTGGEVQTGEGAGWASLVDTLSPLDINRLEVHSGNLAFKDFSSTPPVDIFIKEIQLQVQNLKDVEDSKQALPSPVTISGRSIGDGQLNVEGAMNILDDIPDFNFDIKLEHASLSAINAYSRSLAAIDFVSGDLNIYIEVAAKDGLLTGYIKPVAVDVDMVSIKQDNNPFNLVWESIFSVFTEIFKNRKENQVATQIPIEGNINDFETGTWAAIIGIFKNTFSAFTKDTDNTVDFLSDKK